MSTKPDDFDKFIDEVLTEPDKPPAPYVAPTVQEETANHYAAVILATTPSVPGRTVRECRGLVTARVAVGSAGLRAVVAAIADRLGRRSGPTEDLMLKAEQECFRQLKQAAHAKGCHAVVGVSLQIGELSGEADLLIGVATGTAVVLS